MATHLKRLECIDWNLECIDLFLFVRLFWCFRFFCYCIFLFVLLLEQGYFNVTLLPMQPVGWVRTPALTRTVQVSFVFCLLFFKWSGRVKLWYPAPWVGNTNVPHSAERKGELACVSRFLTYVMASSRMGDHGRTHKGQANEICARGVRIFCRCMRPPKS